MRIGDVEKWVVGRVPIVLRRPKMMALLKVLSAQVGRLMTTGARYADDVRYRLAHTSQVCSMRSMINDQLDADLRRVVIEDPGPSDEMFYVNARADESPTIIGVKRGIYVFVPARGSSDPRELDFVVRVPAAWYGTSKASRLVALVNRNKLASMRYRVEYTIQ